MAQRAWRNGYRPPKGLVRGRRRYSRWRRASRYGPRENHRERGDDDLNKSAHERLYECRFGEYGAVWRLEHGSTDGDPTEADAEVAVCGEEPPYEDACHETRRPEQRRGALITAMPSLVRPGDEDAEDSRKEEEPHDDQCPVLRPFPVIHRCPPTVSLH